MRNVLTVTGFLLLALAVLGFIAFMWLWDLHKLYLLFTDKVPLHKIVGVLILGVVGYPILSLIMDHFEKKSPLHTVIKPEAEDRVRASSTARELIGDNIAFGSEEGYEYSGSDGDFTCPVRGSKGKGDLAVSASSLNGAWHLDSVAIVMKDRRISIPVN